MLRIIKLKSAKTPANQAIIAEIQDILRAQFPGMSEEMIAKLPHQLEDPLSSGFVSELLVAETGPAQIGGFAIVLYMPDLHFAYLDTIATAPGRTGRGIGAALYEEVREEVRATPGMRGLYFECLPDDPKLSPDPRRRRQNAARLRFYERFGAYPILGTAYETPVAEGDTDAPYLMFDGLDRYKLPPRRTLAKIVEAILRRKYGDVCPEDYIRRVVRSVAEGRPHLRPPRYAQPGPVPVPKLDLAIPLVVSERHEIHHVRERGYVEAPARIGAILRQIEPTGLFRRVEPRRFPERWIREVHDPGLVEYLKTACAEVPERKAVYPYVFPIRNPNRRPRERSVLAGYWCIDTFTPITRNAEPAARHAVDCALTAADEVVRGARAAYALVRPPGHHAERKSFGGFCYYGNAAVAAQYLSRRGRVAILDIDYHHGNGQQDIFYERDDVLTVSIHGHPSFAYPYFTGFAGETGRGRGAGYNLNLPLPETLTPEAYREALAKALRRIRRFAPDYLVLALGLDTAKGDPTGTWSNRAGDFREIGRMIGGEGYPTVVVQEGGYRIRTLGINARAFFAGLAEGLARAAPPPRHRPRPVRAGAPALGALEWRDFVTEADVEAIRALVAATGLFSADEVGVAAELAEERVRRGEASGYEFVLAERDGRLAGYACYGPTPGTRGTFDLYWIVVAPNRQGQGIGTALLERVEAAVRKQGGRLLVAETSGRADYAPTRRFYRARGFRLAARIEDFYAPGDDKLILTKALAREREPGASRT